MPTPIFLCGAECNLAAASALHGSVTEHWSSVQGPGTSSIVTSGPSPMRSTRCFRFQLASQAQAYYEHAFSTGALSVPRSLVSRFYVYFATLPTQDTSLLSYDTSVATGEATYVASDSSIRLGYYGNYAASGIVVTSGRWYRVDMINNFASSGSSGSLQIDGIDSGQTYACGNFAVSKVLVGPISSVNQTCDIYYDDIMVSATGADYPIGEGTIAGLYPNADGTHTYNAAADFGKAGTAKTSLNATSSLETTSWQSLKNPLSTSVDNTKFISDQGGANTEFLEWQFDDLPAAVDSVNAVMAVTTNHSDSTSANTITGRVNDGGTTNDIYTLVSWASTSIISAIKVYATRINGGGAWTKTTVDALRFRWGFSTDVNPDPDLDGVMLEVDYVPLVRRAQGITSIQQALRQGSFY